MISKEDMDTLWAMGEMAIGAIVAMVGVVLAIHFTGNWVFVPFVVQFMVGAALMFQSLKKIFGSYTKREE